MSKVQEQWQQLAVDLGKRDKPLGKIITEVGPPTLKLRREPFEALARSILSQQLATKAAAAITGRFQLLGPPFPTAAKVLRLKEKQFRAVGVSNSKMIYLRELAKHWEKGLGNIRWSRLEDQEIVEKLTEVKGIGDWTAHMFLIFSLGRPDVLPVGDFGVRKGVQLLYGMKEMPHPKKMPEMLETWRGASSIGAWYCWRGLDSKLIIDPAKLPV